jgi:hypothetical protein
MALNILVHPFSAAAAAAASTLFIKVLHALFVFASYESRAHGG